jgi:L,D-peptidoglycan transpeptidase YkuD (ErfK/YbiS/YcfS/YnhG family)
MEYEALAHSLQLVLVLAPDGQASKGRLWRFEREHAGSDWKLIGEAEVSLGRNGLARGRGVVGSSAGPGPAKHEGDGKAPTGIFALGPAFGRDSAEQNQVRDFPYVQVSDDLVGVDDPKSRYYNSLVKETEVKDRDWDSAERMARPSGLYNLGLVVKHNWAPGQQPEAYGSCIFLHIWKEPGWPTSGCTAMDAAKLAELLQWLREAKQPRLVQLTKAEYESVWQNWGLPRV